MKQIVLFSVKGCKECDKLRNYLQNRGISFIEKDIDKHIDEYSRYTEIYLPPLLLIVTEDGRELINEGFFDENLKTVLDVIL